MDAADAECFIDDRNIAPRPGRFGKWERFLAEQTGEALHGFVPARWAEIDRDAGLDDGRRIRPATGIAALRALCLWQQFIDLVHEIVRIGR